MRRCFSVQERRRERTGEMLFGDTDSHVGKHEEIEVSTSGGFNSSGRRRTQKIVIGIIFEVHLLPKSIAMVLVLY